MHLTSAMKTFCRLVVVPTDRWVIYITHHRHPWVLYHDQWVTWRYARVFSLLSTYYKVLKTSNYLRQYSSYRASCFASQIHCPIKTPESLVLMLYWHGESQDSFTIHMLKYLWIILCYLVRYLPKSGTDCIQTLTYCFGIMKHQFVSKCEYTQISKVIKNSISDHSRWNRRQPVVCSWHLPHSNNSTIGNWSSLNA